MILNLKAKDNQQKIILEHLTPLISDVLAEKINNGVHITKDNKELISRKDLDSFMEYLYEQAKQSIPEDRRHGKQCVGMEGEDILNIAIHYFEEDSIHGKLFNLDGTEYEPPKPVTKPIQPVSSSKPKPQPKPQISIDDLLGENLTTETPPVLVAAETQGNVIIEERLLEPEQSETLRYVDEETGEIISVEEMQRFDGDIEEPEELPTVSKLLEGVDIGDDQDEPDDDFDIEQERKKMKAFDKNAIIILSDLLGNIFTLE